MRRWLPSTARSVRLCAVMFLSMTVLPRVTRADSPFRVDVRIESSAPGTGRISVDLDMPDGHYVYADSWSVEAIGVTLATESIPAAVTIEDPFLEETVPAYNQPMVFVYRIIDGRHPSQVTITLQGCTPELCLLPERHEFQFQEFETDRPADAQTLIDAALGVEAAPLAGLHGFTLTGREAGYKTPEELIDFIDRTEQGDGLAENPLQQLLRRHGLWLAALFILAGGMALNLTPCVLPMIPVNLAIIGAGTQAESKHHGLIMGLCYGIGMALAYGILGLIVVLTGSQFGQLNSTPWFNAGVAIIFIVLALAMFDVLTIDFTRFQHLRKAGRRMHGPALTALGFGAIAALLAGACVAPVLIWVLVLATEIYQRGNTLGLALPFLLGIGMALPWPLAGAGLAILPKPGRWMERIKIAFGMLILVAGLFYARSAWRLWQGGPATTVTRGDETIGAIDWIYSLEDGLTRARAEHKPVFVDIWATWCTTCIRMDRTTLRNPVVGDRLAGYVPVKFQAENLNAPNVAPFLESWGIMGLPSYVILVPDPP